MRKLSAVLGVAMSSPIAFREFTEGQYNRLSRLFQMKT